MPLKDPVARAAYHRRYYLANRERYVRAGYNMRHVQATRERNRRVVAQIRAEMVCESCGGPVEHFHHRDPAVKRTTIAKAIQTRGTVWLLEEIKRCDLLCADCHKEVHHS